MKEKAVLVNHKVQHRHPGAISFCCLCGGKLQPRLVLPDRRRYQVCSRCGFVDFRGPKLVACCLIIEDGKVLLLRRGIQPQLGKWTFPGGYVELGETAREAAARETLEEVGMHVGPERLAGLYFDDRNPEAGVAVYYAGARGRVPSISHEALEVRYFAAGEIPWPDLAFRTTRSALEDWIASRPPAHGARR